MHLLIVTQVVDRNHPVLGFFHKWIEVFAREWEHVHVIALQVGEYDLPENVSVHSLGKEEGVGKVGYVSRFFGYVWKYRKEYDAVFVHMNQVYVLLGGWLWKFWKKQVALWYVHHHVSVSLRMAERIVDIIFTTDKESFRLPSSKVQYMGHGIAFDMLPEAPLWERGPLHLITIGRVSPVKHVEDIVAVTEKLGGARLTVVGGPATPQDKVYMHNLIAKSSDAIDWRGPVSHAEAVTALADAHLFVHMSETGSTDKVVLEALGAGVPAVSTSEAFKELLEPHGLWTSNHEQEVAKRIHEYMRLPEKVREQHRDVLRDCVRKKHGLTGLIGRITTVLSSPE